VKHPESQTQQAYFQWARLHPIARHAFAIPNGGKRNRITAAILKAEGVKAGVFDTFLPVPMHGRPGFWLEFKQGHNSLTSEQKRFAEAMLAFGFGCAAAYTVDAGIELTIAYLKGQLPSELVVRKQ
jgi:hypothetical protein